MGVHCSPTVCRAGGWCRSHGVQRPGSQWCWTPAGSEHDQGADAGLWAEGVRTQGRCWVDGADLDHPGPGHEPHGTPEIQCRWGARQGLGSPRLPCGSALGGKDLSSRQPQRCGPCVPPAHPRPERPPLGPVKGLWPGPASPGDRGPPGLHEGRAGPSQPLGGAGICIGSDQGGRNRRAARLQPVYRRQ